MSAVAGMILGYDFGNRLAGTLVGVVMGLNGAVFCSILASGAADWVQRRLTRRPTGDD